MALHFILDGYNIVKSIEKLADLKLEDGRRGLVNLIARYRPQGSEKNDVTIVFDGQGGLGAGSIERQRDIRVIFTGSGCADSKIKELIDQNKNPKMCVVVTNDRDIQYYVRAVGAKVLSVEEFTNKVQPKTAHIQTVIRADDKTISKVVELKINKEMEEIWLKRKRAA